MKVSKMINSSGDKMQQPNKPSIWWVMHAGWSVGQRGILAVIKDACDRYGPRVSVPAGYTRKALVLNDPHDARSILVNFGRVIKKSSSNEEMATFLGRTILTGEGALWRKRRALMQSTFSPVNVQMFKELMIAETQKLIRETNKNGIPTTLDFFQLSLELTLRIAARSLFSQSYEDQSREVVKLVTILLEYITFRLRRPWSPMKWLSVRRIKKARQSLERLDSIVLDLVHARKSGSQDHVNDLLNILLRATAAIDDVAVGADSEALKENDLVGELKTLIAAAHETTANTVTWTMYNLASHQDCQEALAKSLSDDDAVNDQISDPRSLLNAVISESLRLFPPGWLLEREAAQNFTFDGFEIAKGTLIFMPVYLIHRLPKYWEDPDLFKPERFQKPDAPDCYKNIYLPFGFGPRRCIGQSFATLELQIIISQIIRSWAVSLVDTKPPQLNDLITLSPKGGLKLQLRERIKQ